MNQLNNKEKSLHTQETLQVIQQMIAVSKHRLNNNGFLLILWGWSMAGLNSLYFLEREVTITYTIKRIIDIGTFILPLIALGITIYFIVVQSKKVKTYIAVSLRYIWIACILFMSLVNLIQYNVTGKINFELQHPLFMALIAFATIISGSIIRSYILIIGGIVFAILAYTASLYPLKIQFIFEAVAWIVAFIIPGHILYAQRKK